MTKDYNNILETIFTQMLGKSNSLSELTATVLEILMNIERKEFLEKHQNTDNKANGFYPRIVKSLSSQLQIQIPRDRQGMFKSFFLEIAKRDNSQLSELAMSMYSHGLSQRSISSILKKVSGVNLSPSSIARAVKELEPIRKQWQSRELDSQYHTIIIDAIHINTRRHNEVDKEAVYVVMGIREGFDREILGIYNMPAESAKGWDFVLQNLRDRGVKHSGLFICDELSGIENSISKNFPRSRIQFCLFHKLKQLTTVVRSNLKDQLRDDFFEMFDLNDPSEDENIIYSKIENFLAKWTKLYPSIKGKMPESKWDNYCTYRHYPIIVRRMLYTTNMIERLNKEIRKVTRHTNSFPNEDSMLNLVFMVCNNMMPTYSKPITSFYPVKQKMNEILFTS